MIKCNLSLLMGKAKILSFSELEEKTGVHRLQLARFFHDSWGRIEKKDLDTLCKFFNCTPGDLFEYVPD